MSAAAGEAAFEAPRDETSVPRLALRDASIALAALTLFGAADAWHAATGTALAGGVAFLDGVLAGGLVAFLAHEWGHFAGARLSGGIAPTTAFRRFFPLFVFDMEHSSPRAFRGMGIGGNVAHWLVVVLFAAATPLDAAGRIALVSSAFGVAVFASTTEFPVLRRAFAGAGAVESFAGLSGAKLRRNQWIGAAAGLALFGLL